MSSFPYTSCDVADALTAQGISEGGFVPDVVQRSFNPQNSTVYGPAYTVLYASKHDPRPALPHHYIDSAPSGSVIVIGASKELTQSGYSIALYGGLMSTRAQYLGCQGSVVFGRIRDINEHRNLQYPVFSVGLGICAPNKVAKVVAVNVAVRSSTGGPEIYPGDTIVGDENGIAVIPADKLDKTLALIPPRVKADELAADDIKQGISAAKAQKTRRQSL